MAEHISRLPITLVRPALGHSGRTALAAVLSLLVARLAGLPEAYWAPIATLIVMQSTLGAALAVSGHRLTGAAIGSVMGGLLASWFGANVLVFTAGIFITGAFCTALQLDAYRYASITLTIVMIIPHPVGPWMAALHRFVEVAIGIGVGLIVTSVWPEPSR